MHDFATFGIGVYVFGVIFLIVLAILWFFLPFAIFGTKDRLDRLIAATEQTNRELARLKIMFEKFANDDHVSTVSCARCGAAAPADATTCPGCGAEFDKRALRPG